MALFDDVSGPVAGETLLVVGSIAGSQYVNHAYLVLLPPILPVLARDLEVSIATLGLALGAQALVNTLFQVPFGYLADHYDRTIALGLSSVLGAVGAGITAVAPDFPTLVAGQVVLGAGVAGHHPSHYPLLSDATAEAIRGRAFAVYNFGGSLGFATPPVVVTGIVAVEGLTWRHALGLLAAAGMAYAVVVTLLFAWRVPDDVTAPNAADAERGATVSERVRSELRALVAEPGILALSAMTLLAATANWGLASYAVVFLTGVYRVQLGVANLALTGLFVVGAGAILLGGYLTDRIGGGRILVASYLGFTVLVAVLAANLVPAVAAVGLFLVLGGVRSLAGPARDELTERLSESDAVGKSFAVVTVGLMLGSTISPPAFGYLIEWAGVRATFFAVAAVGLVSAAVAAAVVAGYGGADRSQPAPGD